MAQIPLPTGSIGIYTLNAPVQERWDYDANSNMAYHGVSLPGTASSAAGWFIEKFTYDGSNRVIQRQLANGCDLANQIWDNRASLSYS